MATIEDYTQLFVRFLNVATSGDVDFMQVVASGTILPHLDDALAMSTVDDDGEIPGRPPGFDIEAAHAIADAAIDRTRRQLGPIVLDMMLAHARIETSMVNALAQLPGGSPAVVISVLADDLGVTLSDQG